MKSLFRRVPALLFLFVGGVMNFTFAGTLGTDPLSIKCWQIISVAATILTATSFDVIQENYRAGEKGRCAAACCILALSVSYDGWAAYGFASQQHAETTHAVDEDKRNRKAADQKVTNAERDLAPYLSAGDVTVAQQAVALARQTLEEIDNLPGIKVNGIPCGNAPGRKIIIEQCPRRQEIAQQLRNLESDLSRADAKVRLTNELAKAMFERDRLPPPAPVDPRTELLGDWLVEVLPVALLMIGSLCGFYAIPPSDPLRRPERQKSWFWKRQKQAETAVSTVTPISTPQSRISLSEPIVRPSATTKGKRNRRGHTIVAQRLAEKLSELESSPLPEGISSHPNGWIKGPQRKLASAVGMSNVTLFHRLLHDAVEAGEVELDTSGNITAVRVKSPAQNR